MCRRARLCLLGTLLILLSNAVSSENVSPDFETVHTSNAAILNRLGLAPLRIPDGHHKKRLAGPEPPGLSSQTRIHQPYNRRHGHRDSHVYIVKLPASPPYYTITKPHKTVKDDRVTKTGPNFPVGFQGNGKPAKIYHWNLPVVKKISEKKRLQSQFRMDQARKKLEESKKQQQQTPPTDKTHMEISRKGNEHIDKHYYNNRLPSHQKSSAKHARNNDKRLNYDKSEATLLGKKANSVSAGNKTYRLDDSNVHRIHLTNELHSPPRNSPPASSKVKKHRKKAAMSYYAPISAKTGSNSIHKNFPGNGKPKAFYVMEKSRKPVYYHPLLP